MMFTPYRVGRARTPILPMPLVALDQVPDWPSSLGTTGGENLGSPPRARRTMDKVQSQKDSQRYWSSIYRVPWKKVFPAVISIPFKTKGGKNKNLSEPNPQLKVKRSGAELCKLPGSHSNLPIANLEMEMGDCFSWWRSQPSDSFAI